MADKKITQLDPLTGADLTDTDEFVVVDLSADETKSITFAELKTGLDTVSGFVRITGDTMTGNLSFGDNNKIIMGAGSDLQLYHDGSNSYVSDQGTGQLVLLSNSFRLNNAANSENIITAEENGAVSLFFNDSSKLATTATGISVSGDASIGHASPTAILDVRRGDASGKIAEFHTSTGFGIELGSSQSEAYIQAGSNQALLFNTNVSNERMRITSAGNVGIGTSLPAPDYGSDVALEIKGASSPGLVINDTGQTSKYGIHADSNDLKITYGSGALVTFQNDGNVGIGTSAPNVYSGYTSLTIDNATNGGIIDIERNGTLVGEMFTTDANTFSLAAVGAKAMNFSTNSAERMRIDSSGRLLVAKTTTAFGTVGHTIWNDGSHDLTASAIPPIQANRLTSDGDIIALYKASSKMGSLGNSGTNFIIQQSNSSGVIQLKNHDNTEDIEFGQDYFRIKQGGAQRMYMNSAGETTFSTKVSVTAADGVRDADYVAVFQNQEATSGRNFGVSIAGGTSTADFALNVVNGAVNTALLRVDGVGNTSITGTIKSVGGGLISSDGTADTLVISGSNAVNTGGSITLEGNAASDVSQIKFKNGSTEVMRAASGKLYFGTSGADPSSSQTGVRISSTDNTNFWMSSTPRTSAYDQFAFFNGNGLVGTITTSGSATAYNTSSDYRLKTDVQPMTGAGERVQALNPVNFEWVADGTRVDGFLAHEAQAVVPESVTGTKDAVDADGNPEYQSIDQSKIVPLLTAALQEALTEITALKARVTTLEGA
jgi:hypothetical protein